MDHFVTTVLKVIYTVGVYGSTEDAFFGALSKHGIDLFIDVRARRGMRGATYRYANSNYLQAKLKQLAIAYAHLPDMAPSQEIRSAQNLADQQSRIAKRKRTMLSENFIRAYRRDVLKVYKRKPGLKFDAAEMLQTACELFSYPPERPLCRVALFCVEREPAACHRSLLADELRKQLGIEVVHI